MHMHVRLRYTCRVCFLLKPPPYSSAPGTQCVYMHMTGAHRAILVETCGDAQESHTVEWDAEFWADILRRLDRFATAFSKLNPTYASVAVAVDHFHALWSPPQEEGGVGARWTRKNE